PSPRIDLGDDHVKLFDAGTWGTLPVFPRLLEAGRRFQETLHPVTTPERLLYVAGYDQKTPHRIKVVAPGKFEYQETLDGDGRVPHELGLLPDVPTLFVLEKHGDLAKNEKVLGAIHDLLVNGSSSLLLSQLPADRAARAAKAPFRPFPSRPVPPELLALAAQVRSARRAKRVTLDAEIAAARLEALVLSEVLGEAPDLHVARTRMATRAALAKRPRLRVEVVWGDLTRVNADVFAVGHYHGVPPTNALGALDRAVSRGTGRSLLDDHVRRGLISGDLGTVTFFPWDRRTLAIAGMGHSGTFGEGELRVLARSLTFAVANVPAARTVATVLIGSGDGGLSVESCIRGMFDGMADALEAGPMTGQVQALRVVEWRRDRASRIHDALKQVQADLASRLEIVLDRSFKAGPGGGIGKEEAVSLLVSAAAAAARQGKTTAGNRRLASLLRGQERALPVLPRLTETLREIPAGTEVALVAAGAPPNAQRIPTRLTFAGDPAPIRVAAITNSATVAERPISIDRTLVDGLVRRMTDPDVAAAADLSDLLRRLLVPHDFLALLRSDESFVFEVDRFMARVHWEMLTGTEDASAEPLSVRTPFARQLRTMYSAPPAPAPPRTEKLTALVIGDPGDPARQHSLPGARREALKVADLLRGHDVEVVALIGAPDETGQGPVAGIRAADRLECLRLLMRGGFDLLHYAGHGDFDPEAPDRVGWLFKDGLLTARELERISAPPRLIVANACLSARASEKADGAALTPSLADEFFRRGVRNYVGTAWEVNDAGAVLFAETLYGALLRKETRPTLGEAVLEARRALWRERHVYGSLWAAYQHYGDPEALVRGDAPAAVDGRPRASKRARPRKRRR
ncbi:MAG TPA: CHAT domain-containing protein, partial [Vicinamibacteria bacterium]|nr:CHAT domain-containing protein [Vicinamibacteria bacterium]